MTRSLFLHLAAAASLLALNLAAPAPATAQDNIPPAAQQLINAIPEPAPTSTRVTARPGASKGEQKAVRWFNMLDVDGDGLISSAEARTVYLFKPSLARDFANADANGDGYLSEQEVRTVADRRRAERRARKQAEEAAKAAASAAQ